jgi:glyoxylase-like metal-dependent hydrolase (beta-lactamase superfamily II)
MRVHHLNCGTMRPFGGRLVGGSGSVLRPATMVCHCLLIETAAGLILVDTGIGLEAVARPRASLGSGFLLATRPVLDTGETAIRQVEALGHTADEVRHVVLTHLDLDHAGGLADFPKAKVHVHDTEFAAAMSPATLGERSRYRSGQWAHGPDWATYGTAEGERWFGFEAVRELAGLPDDLLLIPLAGHSRGHSGVAVRTGGRWLLHAGDAYFFRGEVDPAHRRSTPGLRLFQTVVQEDGTARRRNQDRLHELAVAHGDEVDIISAHDPVELHRRQDAPV